MVKIQKNTRLIVLLLILYPNCIQYGQVAPD